MSSYITFDQSTKPLIHAVVHPVEAEQKDWDAFLEQFKSFLDGQEPFAILFDLTHAKLISMSMVQQLAAFMKANDLLLKEKIIASAVLSNNVLVRGILDILFKIRKPSKPNIVTKHTEKASTFLFNECKKLGYFEDI
jgi:hypothetical protein